MNMPKRPVNPVVQPSLIPPEHLELFMRIGVTDSGNHVQFQVEAWDASAQVLVAMESRPFCTEAQADVAFEWAAEWMKAALASALRPFL